MLKMLTGIAIVFLMIFAGCYPYSKPILLLESNKETAIRMDWEEYGAYYEVDELFVESSFQSSYIPMVGNYSAPVSHAIVSKRIRILTKEGVDYASVPVRLYLNTVQKFDCHLYDPDGKEIPLNSTALKTQYLKEGKIIFPNVTAGCVLDIYIEFKGSTPVVTFEHWFSRKIPVRNARFTFSRVDDFEYAFKEYGKVPVGQSQISLMHNELTHTVWNRKNVLPRSNVDYLDTYDNTEPRVAIAMRYGFNKPVFSDWSDIAGKLRDKLIEEPYTVLDRHIEEVFDTLMRGTTTQYEKADKALAWVQSNISYDDGYNEFDPDQVIADGRGNLQEIALTLKNMYKFLGLKVDIIMTRPHDLGGFDETFVSPICTVIPFVVTTIEGKQYCAYPFIRGGILGEYPRDFFNLKGLSLQSRAIRTIPVSVSDESHSDFSYVIDLDDEEFPHTLDLTYTGYMAYRFRSMLLSMKKKDIKEGFQKIIASFEKSNALQDCEVYNLNERGKPLKAKLTFYNSDQVIERKGKTHINLSHLFSEYFSSLDTNRTSPFIYKNKMTTHESIVIKKTSGKRVSATMASEALDNVLFDVTCFKTDNDEFFEFTRDISFNQCNIAPRDLSPVYQDIVKLNQIKESYLIIE